LGFSVFEFCVALIFGSRTNVFLLGKAEIAVETRQVFLPCCDLKGFAAMEPSVQTQGQRYELPLSFIFL